MERFVDSLLLWVGFRAGRHGERLFSPWAFIYPKRKAHYFNFRAGFGRLI